jgi:hypothetical protein
MVRPAQTDEVNMRLLFIALALAVSLPLQLANAADMPGKALVDKHCQRCHDNSIFTRPDSIIHSWSELQARVEFCDSASHAGMTEEEMSQVVEYLNKTFYKFPKP